MSVTILHLADLHLDTPFKSLTTLSATLSETIKQATKQSFMKLVDIAIDNAVDAVIIAGDIFNSKQPSVSAQLFLREQLLRLVEQHIPVIIGYGNHDFYQGSLLVDLPKEVNVFKDDVTTFSITTKSKERLMVSGFSYYTQHVTTVEWSNFPKKQIGTYHIGMLHGQMEKRGVYAPFTVEQLETFGYDYWALGHIHKRQVISKFPLAAYSGNIQGLHINDSGLKGGYLVRLSSTQEPVMTEVNTASIIWEKCYVTIKENSTLTSVLEQMQQKMQQLPKNNGLYFIRMIVTYDENVTKSLLDALVSEDIVKWGQQKPYYLIDVVLEKQATTKKAIVLDDKTRERITALQQANMSSVDILDMTKQVMQHKLVQQFFNDTLQDSSFLDDIYTQSVAKVLEVLGGDDNVY